MSILYRLVLIFCGLSITYATSLQQDYCDLSLCPKGKHVACDNNLKHYGQNCTMDAELLETPEKLRDGIVLRMNELRNQLAGGGFSGFTPADRMATVQWDDELAHLAKFNVLKCILKRDRCRNTRKYGHVGQTISYRGYRKRIPRLDKIVLKQINNWFSEHEMSSMADIFAYKGPTHGVFKRNFLQISEGKNNRIGCALLQQTQNEWLQTFLTCNYGYAPVVGKDVYTSGGVAASRCKTGKNPSFPNLCSIDEVYRKDEGYEDEIETNTKRNQSNVTSSTAEGATKNVTETIKDSTTKPTEEKSTEKPANSTADNKETNSDGSLQSRTFKILPRTQTANKTETSDTVATNITESSVTPASNETATQPTVQANSTEISTTLSTNQSSTVTTPTTTETAKSTTPKPSKKETVNENKNDVFYRFIRFIVKLHALANKYQIKIITQNHEVEKVMKVLSKVTKTRTENISRREKHVGDAQQNRQLRMRSRGIRGRTMKQKHKEMWRSKRHQKDLSDGLVKWRTI